MTPRVDLTGQQFGRLSVIGPNEVRDHHGRVLWMCRCQCGRTTDVSTLRLRSGNTKSCGCLKAEGQSRVTHGHARKDNKDPLYLVWKAMRARCSNPNDRRWESYGGRGITVCPEWDASFAAFLRDVGPRPAPGLSIDRVDNDGNYEPGNVRWATAREQRLNQRPRRKAAP